jgi:hypothetical protein
MNTLPTPTDRIRRSPAPIGDRFTITQDRRLTPDHVLGARSAKVAALLAASSPEATR